MGASSPERLGTLSDVSPSREPTTSVAALIQTARALATKVDAVRENLDRERALPIDLVDPLGAAGMFSLWLPKSLGGAELNAVDYVRVIEELSRLDGSVGWCASIASAYSCIAGYLQPDVASRIYEGARAVVAGAVMPIGKAFIDNGGYSVTGHWTYGSGIRHSQWTLGSCIVHDGDGPRKGPGGTPEIRLAMFPTSSAEVIDTWRVGGLRGTGSNDYRVANLFVPEEYTISFPAPLPAQEGTLYAMPLMSLLAVAIAAVPLGIARAAIDAVITLASVKPLYGSSTLLRDRPAVQADVARAEILLGSARSYLFSMFGGLWDEVATGAVIPLQRRAMARLACANAGQASAQAVDLVYNAAGGTALLESGRLERCFRDVHACTQHIAISTMNYEAGGRVLLGLDPGMPRI